jgi:hypothetical protein
VIIDVLINVFHTHFDRGLKVRLFVRHNGEYDAYVPQTKIWKGRTNLSERVFGALFNDSYPKSSTHALEKGSEHAF